MKLMEFSTKKVICKISACILALSAAAAMTIPSFANHIEPNPNPFYPSNFNTYSHTWYGSVSKLETTPSYSKITSTNSNYDGRYKKTNYSVYEINANHNYVYLSGATNSGCSVSVYSYVNVNQNAIARKLYTAEIRKGVNSTNEIKDDYNVDIRL